MKSRDLPRRVLATLFCMGWAVSANAALTYSFFYDEDGDTPNAWGEMTIDVFDDTTLSVLYQGLNPFAVGAGDQQATGFGFDFNPDVIGLGVDNPPASGRPDLDWIVLDNLSAIPNPTNSGTITKGDFTFGVTEGNANNINPPGVFDGEQDSYFITGFTGLTTADLADTVNLVGVRYQSVLDSINGGSLFLVGSEGTAPPINPPAVPVPAPLALIGLGGLVAGLLRRRRT